MNKWREKKWPVLSIIYCLLYSIYCLLYTWNCKIFHVLCVLPLYCLLHWDDKSDTKRWHHDHGLHIKIGHGKSITSQLILTNGLNNVSITRSTPRHADSPRIPTMQCDDHFVPAPSSQGSRGLQTHPDPDPSSSAWRKVLISAVSASFPCDVLFLFIFY